MAELPWTMTEPTQDDWGGWICRAEERDDDGDTSPICGMGRTAEDARRNCELAVNRVNAHEELAASLDECVEELGLLIDAGEAIGIYADLAHDRGKTALEHFSGQPMKGAEVLQAARFLYAASSHVITVHELYKDQDADVRLAKYEQAAERCKGAVAFALGGE